MTYDCDDCECDCGTCEGHIEEEAAQEACKVTGSMLHISINAAELETRVAAMFHKQLQYLAKERFDEVMNDKIAEVVSEQAGKIIEDSLRPAVEKIISEGWKKTDRWGNPIGDGHLSLRQRIEDFFSEKTGSYGNETTRINSIVKEYIEKAVRTEFSDLLSSAKKQFHETIERNIQAVLTKELRDTVESNVKTAVMQMIKNILENGRGA